MKTDRTICAVIAIVMAVLCVSCVREKSTYTDEVLCSVGVDSGTCGIYDKEYYEKYHFDETNDDEWYKKNVCNGFWNRKGEASNLDNKGIISCSGYGDGHYTVYVKRNKEGLIYQITIKYIWQ